MKNKPIIKNKKLVAHPKILINFNKNSINFFLVLKYKIYEIKNRTV